MPCLSRREPRRAEVLRGMRRASAPDLFRVSGAEPVRQQILRRVWRQARREHPGAFVRAGRDCTSLFDRAARAAGGSPGTLRIARVLHAEASGREDPHLAKRNRRRAQAGHRDVHGRVGLHRDVRAARSRGSPRDHGPRLRSHSRRRPRIRGHDQPVPRRRRHGAFSARRSPTRTMRAARCGPRSPSRRARAPPGGRPARPRAEFRMRIGINSGPVVVGAIGRDLRMDYTALGDTVNLAAPAHEDRAARPDRGQREHAGRLCEGYLRVRGSREVPGEGKDRAVRAYGVQREIAGRTRLEVSRERGLTPLVGRAAERERLTEVFRQRQRRRRRRGPASPATRASASRACSTSFCEVTMTATTSSSRRPASPTGAPWRTARSSSFIGDYLDLSEGLTTEEIKARVAAWLR